MFFERRTWLIICRSLFFLLFLIALDESTDLGTSLILLAAASSFGITQGVLLSSSKLLTRGFLTVQGALFAGVELFLFLLERAPVPGDRGSLKFFATAEHLRLVLLIFLIASVSTWLLCRYRHALTLEAFLILLSGIHILSGHRQFHLDLPKFSNSLAWSLDIEPLTMLVGFGGALVSIVLFYLLLGGPLLLNTSHRVSVLRLRTLGAVGLLSGTGLVLFFIAQFLHGHFEAAIIEGGKVSNGVGQSSESGSSPLGFHSALGGTSQPAALVRLEGDYTENPFTPMLYLREAALSELGGQQMVIAGSEFDGDVPRVRAAERFSRSADSALPDRKEIVQAIFLLGDQRSVFAIDYPLSIAPLKNPNPQRFRAAYRAVSLAPAFQLEDLADKEVGDPTWDKSDWDHYLAGHQDSRYKDLAHQITAEVTRPVGKALAITQFLNAKAVYTLTPNHEVPPNSDPVAPFLFGDLRGYCVHFAHATVYMLRSLGIPARIGTGYLTDLSQSKDGHILLRLSDRHAWAEVYVRDHGWIPFDTQPQQVESHADSQVDMKLLDELMGLVLPDEEILPENADKDEPQTSSPTGATGHESPALSTLLVLTLMFLIGGKIYTRYSWVLAFAPRTRLLYSYRSFAARLQEMGVEREIGETQLEFTRRLSSHLDGRSVELTAPLLSTLYSARPTALTPTEIDVLRRNDLKLLRKFPWWKRLLGLVNPFPVFSFLSRVR